jgi:hypothetical protein
MNHRNPKLSNSQAVLPERCGDPEEEAAPPFEISLPTANPSTMERLAAPMNPSNPQLSISQDVLLKRHQDPKEDAIPFEIPAHKRHPSTVFFDALFPDDDDDGSISSKSSSSSSSSSDSDSDSSNFDSDSDSSNSSSQAR